MRLLLSAHALAIDGGAQGDNCRLQRAATILGSIRGDALALRDGLRSCRGGLVVSRGVGDRHVGFRGIAIGVRNGHVDGVTRHRSNRADHLGRFGILRLWAFAAIPRRLQVHGFGGDGAIGAGGEGRSVHVHAVAGSDIAQLSVGELGDLGRADVDFSRPRRLGDLHRAAGYRCDLATDRVLAFGGEHPPTDSAVAAATASIANPVNRADLKVTCIEILSIGGRSGQIS
jgi:hypothetical protein